LPYHRISSNISSIAHNERRDRGPHNSHFQFFCGLYVVFFFLRRDRPLSRERCRPKRRSVGKLTPLILVSTTTDCLASSDMGRSGVCRLVASFRSPFSPFLTRAEITEKVSPHSRTVVCWCEAISLARASPKVLKSSSRPPTFSQLNFSVVTRVELVS